MGLFDKLGGAIKGGLGGLLSGGPVGAVAGGLGGLIGGGGAQGAGLGALGGLIGGQQGLNPALIAAISGLGNAQLQEQQAGRQGAEEAANFRNDQLSRNLQLAEQQFADQGPLRESGMGALTQFLGGNTRGIFNDSAFAGDIGLGGGQGGQPPAPGITGAPDAPIAPPLPLGPPQPPQGPGAAVLPPSNTFQGPDSELGNFGRGELTRAGGIKLAGDRFDPSKNSLADLLKQPDISNLRGQAGVAAQTAQLAPDARKDGELNAIQLLKRRDTKSKINQARQPSVGPSEASFGQPGESKRASKQALRKF